MIIKKAFAYKVKYYAHKMIHVSMQEHYNKLRRYLEALKSTDTYMLLMTNPCVKTFPPVFQRLFVYFDGLKKGWLGGCKKLICIDACFLKTFLGGQLLVVVWRDDNDQMYPITWAVMEGENNDSWEWFFTEM